MHHDGFFQAIRENPDDDAHRLVYDDAGYNSGGMRISDALRAELASRFGGKALWWSR